MRSLILALWLTACGGSVAAPPCGCPEPNNDPCHGVASLAPVGQCKLTRWECPGRSEVRATRAGQCLNFSFCPDGDTECIKGLTAEIGAYCQ
jgi:hypothetical protein